MRRHVLDASALLAFLEERPGAARVGNLLTRAAELGQPTYISAVNWGEVYYVVWRGRGERAANEILAKIGALPIQIVDVDTPLAKQAATFKARFKLPYADCFAAALAQERKAVLVTSDRNFESVERNVKLLWVDSGR